MCQKQWVAINIIKRHDNDDAVVGFKLQIFNRRKTDYTRNRDPDSVEKIKEHQHMNRAIAMAYSAITGATVKIINNHDNAIDKAVKEAKPILEWGNMEKMNNKAQTSNLLLLMIFMMIILFIMPTFGPILGYYFGIVLEPLIGFNGNYPLLTLFFSGIIVVILSSLLTNFFIFLPVSTSII